MIQVKAAVSVTGQSKHVYCYTWPDSLPSAKVISPSSAVNHAGFELGMEKGSKGAYTGRAGLAAFCRGAADLTWRRDCQGEGNVRVQSVPCLPLSATDTAGEHYRYSRGGHWNVGAI